MSDLATGADRQIRGEGSSDQDWLRWSGWQIGIERSAAQLIAPSQRLVVIAPHPDDEVLAAGGLIQLAVRQRTPVLVIGVTGGGASHPGSRRWPADRLVATRQRERLQALQILGLARTDVVDLDLPDGGVSAAEGLLVDQLTGLLRPSDLVISPWRYDGHPDHESTAVAAGQAAGTCGARHLQAPIWGWHWADPDTDQLPATGVTLIRLDGPAHTAKRQAIDCFASQLQPDPSTGAAAILPDWAIRRLSRPVEVLLA